MKFKKVYVEITNRCNLSCDFCIKNNRNLSSISYEKFEFIIDKIKNYTEEVYFHVLGEPLIHKDINTFIDYASREGLLVNITTNGYLIDRIRNNNNIHRLNISLHSYDIKYGVSLDRYLDKIFDVVDNIRSKTFISLRLWVMNKNNDKILKYINERYNTNIVIGSKNSKIKVVNNLIIDIFHPFIWPDINNDYYSVNGKCMGLINHFGILVDGTIIPCCLDSRGIIRLGNIYQDNLSEIFNSEIVKNMIDGFHHNYKFQELCRHCNFYNGN